MPLLIDPFSIFENYCGICGWRTLQSVENGCLVCRGRHIPTLVVVSRRNPNKNAGTQDIVVGFQNAMSAQDSR